MQNNSTFYKEAPAISRLAQTNTDNHTKESKTLIANKHRQSHYIIQNTDMALNGLDHRSKMTVSSITSTSPGKNNNNNNNNCEKDNYSLFVWEDLGAT